MRQFINLKHKNMEFKGIQLSNSSQEVLNHEAMLPITTEAEQPAISSTGRLANTQKGNLYFFISNKRFQLIFIKYENNAVFEETMQSLINNSDSIWVRLIVQNE